MRSTISQSAIAAFPSIDLHPIDALRAHLDLLECRLRHNEILPLSTIQRVRDCLEAIPCTTSEYSRALNHLVNAAGYYRRREFGAARYELVTLLKQLRPLTTDG